VVRGSGLTGAATSSLRAGGGDRIGSTRGFRAGRSADGTGSETDGSTGCGFGVKSASAAWRALVIRSRSSLRGWCCCCRWLSKGCPDCLVARDIEVEFVNFGRSLPQMLDATSTSKSTKAHKIDSGKFTLFRSGTRWGVQPFCKDPKRAKGSNKIPGELKIFLQSMHSYRAAECLLPFSPCLQFV
jgi:hypothetical protein